MVLGYEQVVLLGRTDGIIPPINTTQPIHFLRATCGPSVCGIYFNTNHTNLTNCAGVNLQLGKNSIRVRLERFVLKTRIELFPSWRLTPAQLVRFERFVLKKHESNCFLVGGYPAQLERFVRFVLK